VQYQHDGLLVRLWAQDFQPLDDDGLKPYQRLPGVDASYQGRLLGPLTWSLATAWADFERPNGSLTGIAQSVGRRMHVEPRIQLPIDAAHGFVHFAAGYRYTKYDLNDVPVGADAEPERNIWLGSVDSGLYFERDTHFFGITSLQTLEPRLFYLYQQYENQDALPEFDVSQLDFTFDQLFRDNRFAGLDRIADANQLTAALTTRFLNPQTGQERLRLSLGQIAYFDDRRVTVSGTSTSEDRHTGSPLAAMIGASLGGNFSVLTNATFDPNDGNWDEVGAALQYRRDNRHIVNLGYRHRDDLAPFLRQWDQSVYWSLFRNWSVLGRFNYDLREHRTIETLAGLEYSDCCWQLRLVGRRFLTQPGNVQTSDVETDKGIYLQIVFKGLAGLGGRIDSLMENGIPGYRTEEF
jgi:LPS-assembly protein